MSMQGEVIGVIDGDTTCAYNSPRFDI